MRVALAVRSIQVVISEAKVLRTGKKASYEMGDYWNNSCYLDNGYKLIAESEEK